MTYLRRIDSGTNVTLLDGLNFVSLADDLHNRSPRTLIVLRSYRVEAEGNSTEVKTLLDHLFNLSYKPDEKKQRIIYYCL